jgi:hypothetical protein
MEMTKVNGQTLRTWPFERLLWFLRSCQTQLIHIVGFDLATPDQSLSNRNEFLCAWLCGASHSVLSVVLELSLLYPAVCPLASVGIVQA